MVLPLIISSAIMSPSVSNDDINESDSSPTTDTSAHYPNKTNPQHKKSLKVNCGSIVELANFFASKFSYRFGGCGFQ